MPAGKLLLISNGHGEDSIGAEIVRRLPKSVTAHAYPMLGDGRAYAGVCAIAGPRRHLPSEGHRVRGSLLRDAIAGFGIGPATTFMRRDGKAYDMVLVVGDITGVALCWWAGVRVRIYLDVYKSGYDNRYSWFERWLITRSCGVVFNRDPILAAQLRAAGLDARSPGNVMMDTLMTGPYDAAARRRHGKAITILPGSRESMRENFTVQLAALRHVPKLEDVDLFLALARAEDAAALASATGMSLAGDALSDGALTINAAAGSLGAILSASDLVVGQAGTANLQALGLGKPVVSFFADDSTTRRQRRNAAFAGDSRVFTERTPEALAAAITHLLRDDADRLRRGAIGRERMGPPGALDAVVAEVMR